MRTLETERLILRNWVETDLEDLYEYASVEGVGEMAGWPHHTDIEVTKRILEGFIEKDEVYAIVLKDSQKVIGSLGIHNRAKEEEKDEKIQREIGYVLSKDYWGKGLVPEAVKAVIQYAFDEMHVDVLWCGHFVTNQRSKRVIEKCGFLFYEEGVYEAKQLGTTFADKRYCITREDYQK